MMPHFKHILAEQIFAGRMFAKTMFAGRTVAGIALAGALAAFAAGCGVFTRADEDEVLYSTGVIKVDSRNGVWDDEYGRTDDPKNCRFEFEVLRKRSGIAVKATVFDDKIVTDDCKTGDLSCRGWDDDNIEVFFDGDNDKSPDSREGDAAKFGGEYILVANGAACSDYSAVPKSFGRDWTGMVSVTRLESGGYRLDYDLWFSWKCIGRDMPPYDDRDLTIGFNICAHDDDTGGRNDRALYWKGNPAMPYRDESKFGELILKGIPK